MSLVDDSFNFGRPASRYHGKHAGRRSFNPRALSHGAIASASVIFLYIAFRLI